VLSTVALSEVRELAGSPATMSRGLRVGAVLAAALLHLSVLFWLLNPWHDTAEPMSSDILPVTMVFEPPTARTPTAPPQPPAKSEPVARQSGPDAHTTAPATPPPPDDAKKADAPAEAVAPEPPSEATPKPQPSRPAARPREEKPPNPQATARPAPHSPARVKNAAPGERQASGDPYFNAAVVELEKHRFYPALARPLGLVGVAVFDIRVDRTGRIIGLRLEVSSGAELLDRAAEKMIRDTDRFPPPPADIPGDPITFWVEISMAPR
jgi:periplasmic protein TonB